MNSVELVEHQMITAMFIDSHRPDHRYMSRATFAEYHVSVDQPLFRSIALDLKSQGITKTSMSDMGLLVRLHSDAHKNALNRILKNLGATTFSVDWDTKRILTDADKVEDALFPCPENWMLASFAKPGAKDSLPTTTVSDRIGRDHLQTAATEGPWTKAGVIVGILALIATVAISALS
ncbi:MAG: hypothetical protein DI554_00295 [Sphingobium sp.]|nr:MAG: hypothetical protein DI554_00295 [Sphingobium sp.]